uniref:uncharacterized protein LOC108950649 n=1 Tax=Ciona intestinalis TaxID=7719 RepID=UPI00089DC60D|nr:uncharacterized protein LOC108950649 [Ciona intestinalis]|eukprot:XP_018672220.1 uncharacterized protein LOC108950649 [Ciona intestinalis]
MSSVLKLKKIAGAVIRKFSIGSTDTKIGLVGFRGGSINPMVSQLKERKTQPDLITFLNALTFTGPGVTATPTSYIQNRMFTPTMGDRLNAGNVIVIMQPNTISINKGGTVVNVSTSSVFDAVMRVEAAIRK